MFGGRGYVFFKLTSLRGTFLVKVAFRSQRRFQASSPGPKPTLIYSNFKFIEKLFLPLPADKVWEAETSIKQPGSRVASASSSFQCFLLIIHNKDLALLYLFLWSTKKSLWSTIGGKSSPNRPRYVDSSGQHRVSGGRDLKSTQAYPRLFGHAVAQLFLSERDAVRQAIAERKTLGLVADCVSSEWSKEEWANLDQKD